MSNETFMTTAEHSFFERMQHAPQEQKDSLHTVLQMVMGSYGEEPDACFVLLHVGPGEDVVPLSITAVNAAEGEAYTIVASALNAIHESRTGQDRAGAKVH